MKYTYCISFELVALFTEHLYTCRYVTGRFNKAVQTEVKKIDGFLEYKLYSKQIAFLTRFENEWSALKSKLDTDEIFKQSYNRHDAAVVDGLRRTAA